MKNEEIKVCCLCGEVIDGHGNSPEPLSQNEDDQCCDLCNFEKVIPARLSHIF